MLHAVSDRGCRVFILKVLYTDGSTYSSSGLYSLPHLYYNILSKIICTFLKYSYMSVIYLF